MAETNPLLQFKPKHDLFVALDSDGCVFDSMELKHKECFVPMFIKYWNLQAAAKYARQVWEFANLYSVDRGMNRFPVLVRSLDLLRDYPEAMARGIEIPDLKPLRDFVNSGVPQSNASLSQLLNETNDSILSRTLEWSHAVNQAVSEFVKGVPPFPRVRECLDKIVSQADLTVVSGTPGEALVREWKEHELDHYPAVIAGQELGKKIDHLRAFTGDDRYRPDRMLMIGDAPGDLKAARGANMLFYPINPGHEEESWQRLHDEALGRFFAGEYGGPYQDDRIAEFESLLPTTPPWKKL